MIENDEKQALEITEILKTLLEAATHLYQIVSRHKDNYKTFTSEMLELMGIILTQAQIQNKEAYNELYKTIYNSIVSLKRIIQYAEDNTCKALSKIEFELLPILRCAYIRFYYLTLIKPIPEKFAFWLEKEAYDQCKNYYIEDALQSGTYKYDISIIVIAYNKLAYTQMCVESIRKNLPKGLKCELILLNHGSSDGTKEYFESLDPTKQMDFQKNGGGLLSNLFITEGKYIAVVSNDVILTPNALEIFYEALEEDPNIGYAVPMTSNISNLQTPECSQTENFGKIHFCYDDIKGLESLAKRVNIRDPKKEEVRFRFCNPMGFYRAEYYMNSSKTMLAAHRFSFNMNTMFPDDFLSMHLRRTGLKNVLMKDVYCHHFGTVTIEEKADKYLRGRQQFFDQYGIDPWGAGFCWNYNLFSQLQCNKNNAKRILGIDCGLGSDPLKIREELKEKTGNFKVKIINFTNNKRYIADLAGISDEVYFHQGWDDILMHLTGNYDYIITSRDINKKNDLYIIQELYKHLASGGIIIIFTSSELVLKWVQKNYKNVKTASTMNVSEAIKIEEGTVAGSILFWKKDKEEC